MSEAVARVIEPLAVRRTHGLSKSRIALFEQCPKRLWLSVHRPEYSAESVLTQRAFRVGHEVGEIACSLYTNGIMIDARNGLAAAADATTAALQSPERRPLFEATFFHGGVIVRVDLLLPEPGGWHLVEVKSTTRVKPYQQADLATQLWVMRGCGVPVTRASVRVINTSFTLERAGDYAGLFNDEQAGELVEELVAGRGAIVGQAADVLAGPEPVVAIGGHCTEPFSCSFHDHCRRHLPAAPDWPVSILPGVAGKALARRWAEDDIGDLMTVDAAGIVAPLLRRVHAATVSGVPWHDAGAIVAETCDWAYPRTFLDFETIAFAVPRWIGTRPYQQVPFQFSAHVDRGDRDKEHVELLQIDGDDPRGGCARALAALPKTGAVIAWNAGFERSCLLGLAAVAPEHAAALRSLADRLVDLLPVARRHYYHRDMRGSWSIKAVLPTLAPELDYKVLDGARSGVEAQDLFMEAISASTSAERRVAIRSSLLAYCHHDTIAMVVALERLCRSGATDDTAARD